MTKLAANKVPQPHHVPDELVRDFDLYNIPGTVDGYTDDVHALWKAVQDSYPDVFWTPRHGGHWILTRHQEMVQLTTKPELFSSLEPFIPIGITPYAGPPQMDAPEHPAFRTLVQRAFTPDKLHRAGERARLAAQQLVAELRPRGRCDFMHDFIGLMPIITFLNLLGMPESEAPYLHDLASRMVPGQPGAPEAQIEAGDYILALIADRQQNPKDDFITELVNAQVMDRALTEHERLTIVQLVVTGGLDTVVNMTSFAATHFARHPNVQREVRERPEDFKGAMEEITRMFGTSNLARVARQDLELGGVRMLEGEQILSIYPLAGLDERVNPEPTKFDARRKVRRHLNFGSGPHTCLGARLAMREIQIFLEEWVAKMPEFRIVEGTAPRMSSGLINSMRDLYLEWDA